MTPPPWVKGLVAGVCLVIGFVTLMATVSLHLYFEFHHEENHLALFTMLAISVFLIWLGGYLTDSKTTTDFTQQVEHSAPTIGDLVARFVPGGRRATDRTVVVPEVPSETPVPPDVAPRPALTDHDRGVL